MILSAFSLSLTVLLLFDYVIALSQEVDTIWRRKWTAATWLYVLTRYGTVLDKIVLNIPAWDLTVSKDQDIA